MTAPIAVTIEAAPKKAFATAADWPGWSRSAKTEEAALETLAAYADRYRPVVEEARLRLARGAELALEVVEHVGGSSGTEFGVPGQVTEHDRRPVTAAEADRLARLVEAAWTVLDRVVAAAPAELRKGPRGGGRDRDKIVAHVVEAERAYAREIGLRIAPLDPGDRDALAGMRAAVLDVLREASDGSPLAGRKWTARYAAHRIAWHVLDHAWEIEDKSEPAG
jgi:hypothetical protein